MHILVLIWYSNVLCQGSEYSNNSINNICTLTFKLCLPVWSPSAKGQWEMAKFERIIPNQNSWVDNQNWHSWTAIGPRDAPTPYLVKIYPQSVWGKSVKYKVLWTVTACDGDLLNDFLWTFCVIQRGNLFWYFVYWPMFSFTSRPRLRLVHLRRQRRTLQHSIFILRLTFAILYKGLIGSLIIEWCCKDRRRLCLSASVDEAGGWWLAWQR